MKAETYRLFYGMVLGAACMLLVMQFADADRSKERNARFMAAKEEELALYRAKPIDYERIRQLSEKSLAIIREREADPWIIRNLSPIGSGLIFIAVGMGWIETMIVRQKKNA